MVLGVKTKSSPQQPFLVSDDDRLVTKYGDDE